MYHPCYHGVQTVRAQHLCSIRACRLSPTVRNETLACRDSRPPQSHQNARFHPRSELVLLDQWVCPNRGGKIAPCEHSGGLCRRCSMILPFVALSNSVQSIPPCSALGSLWTNRYKQLGHHTTWLSSSELQRQRPIPKKMRRAMGDPFLLLLLVLHVVLGEAPTAYGIFPRRPIYLPRASPTPRANLQSLPSFRSRQTTLGGTLLPVPPR
mmetsp:Transcript_15829/g.43648  ORF Transcript_15829/g.43648 Transcript_15829/m.43648 type:complete len:210 (+) Transcript_15829:1425-2054(+)